VVDLWSSMSKELIRASQFCKAESVWNDELELSAEQKAELASLYTSASATFKPGRVMKGKIIAVSPEGVLVDINYKSDGLIPLYEFTDHEAKKLAVGNEIEVIIDELENMEGNVILSYEKAKAMKAWGAIMKLYEEGKPVEGVVTHKVKGGLSVDIGIPAFLPGSQVDVQRIQDFDSFVGQKITAYIIKVNPKRGNVIISRRKYLHEQRSEVRKKILDTLQVGQIIQGVVKNITNYGAFIDIGGVDGLLHITDMTWTRIAHPSEIIKIGETIPVVVLSFDKANEKISLGMKQLSGNPWENLPEEIQVGARIKGNITGITENALFVELSKGIEGRVYISEISWTDRIQDLAKMFKVGDEIETVVTTIDKENRRISLSVKQLEKSPWDTALDEFEIGQHVKGKVSNITDFGLFVQIAPGVDGLVHISDLSWTEHIKHPSDIYQKGDEVEAVVLDVNKAKKKISLGVKQLTENPWQQLETTHPVGSTVEGEVMKIVPDLGAFVRLSNGIEGLVHISEAGSQQLSDLLKVGQKAEFKVLKINQEEQKVSLGMNLEHEPRKKSEKQPRTKRFEQTQAPAAQKIKTSFQIELEKHAARLNKKNNG
jgi:small subunit ribosomal protein S1